MQKNRKLLDEVRDYLRLQRPASAAMEPNPSESRF
jgi:hypothetical protein